MSLIAGDVRIGAVVVDGFEVFGADRIPGDIVIFFQFFGDVAHDVFDEFGIGKRGFGDVLFVHAF